jgi:hypothetical protein
MISLSSGFFSALAPTLLKTEQSLGTAPQSRQVDLVNII